MKPRSATMSHRSNSSSNSASSLRYQLKPSSQLSHFVRSANRFTRFRRKGHEAEIGDYVPSLELVFKLSQFFALPIEAIFSTEPFRPLSEQVYTLQKKGA